MNDILNRVNQVEKSISTVKNKIAYRDLRKMLDNVDKVITEISKESVECRRMKKDTLKYMELKEKANSLLNNLEQHVTFASLIS